MSFTTADEARKIAGLVVNESTEAQMSMIHEAIKEGASQGRFSITLDSSPSVHVKAKLEALGYKITTCDDPRERTNPTTISWA